MVDEEVSSATKPKLGAMAGINSKQVEKMVIDLKDERNKLRQNISFHKQSLAEGERTLADITRKIGEMEKERLLAVKAEELFTAAASFIRSVPSHDMEKMRLLSGLTQVLKYLDSSNTSKEQLLESIRAVEGICVNPLDWEASCEDTLMTPDRSPRVMESLRSIDDLPTKILHVSKKIRPIRQGLEQHEDKISEGDEVVVGSSASSKVNIASKDIDKEEVNYRNLVAARNLVTNLQPLLAPGDRGILQMKQFTTLFRNLFKKKTGSTNRQKDIDALLGFLEDRLKERADFVSDKHTDEDHSNQPEPSCSSPKRPAESQASDSQTEKFARMGGNGEFE